MKATAKHKALVKAYNVAIKERDVAIRAFNKAQQACLKAGLSPNYSKYNGRLGRYMNVEWTLTKTTVIS